MSIFDIDKTNADRTTPTPNAPDNIDSTRMAHSTLSTSYLPTGGKIADARIQMLNNRIVNYGPGGVLVTSFGQQTSGKYAMLLADSTGIPRIYIGQAPTNGRIGIWVSKPGLNVITLLGG